MQDIMEISPVRKQYLACFADIMKMCEVPEKESKSSEKQEVLTKDEASFKKESSAVQDEPMEMPALFYFHKPEKVRHEQSLLPAGQTQSQEVQMQEIVPVIPQQLQQAVVPVVPQQLQHVVPVVLRPVPQAAPVIAPQNPQAAPVIPPEVPQAAHMIPPQKRKLEEEEAPRKKAKVDVELSPQEKLDLLHEEMQKLLEAKECGICSDFMTYPATLPCGHNFCLKCVNARDARNVPEVKVCPMCRERFDATILHRNIVLEDYIKFLVKIGMPEKVEEYNEKLQEDYDELSKPGIFPNINTPSFIQ